MTNICDDSHPIEDREVLNYPLKDGWSFLKGLQALVIDDNFDALELTKLILEGYEIEVQIADSASKCFKLFSQLKPDILICDITIYRKQKTHSTEWAVQEMICGTLCGSQDLMNDQHHLIRLLTQATFDL